ncbi:pyrroline-5-carboxylate reductase [Aureimonas leprariae]|uniref:Pyrroline-5-carboxylate reductase n=1 Tax=Plantimonas leprariae TaxID=2615207 RepID=A0A7V7PPF7_9HYPH|nr:pyrroline-5-carboxylate reductase [Aureimonas leprariae]KAB0679802.1 pyrroline-5-carboxylate reductase [Aureimonas leprariae]
MSDKPRTAGRVLLLGGGNMGGAMARGWAEQGSAGAIHVVDPQPGEALRASIEAGRLTHSTAVPDERFDVVVLAVKPQTMATALPPVRAAVGPQTIVISVAAGTTTKTIADHLGDGVAIVRAMPNTPALIGRGITGCFAGENVSQQVRDLAESLLSACGPVVWVAKEADIDVVTAVSGSGPAYVFLLAETLAAAGEAAGLTPELAMTLARHTVAGAGELMVRSEDAPAVLRRNVTSPNGTTQAALDVLMGEGGLAPLMRRAVEAAKRRAAELSEG